ncbi:MAG: hypothetical protein IPI39_15030 [Candidatus Obscuribacter sp.]|nr:hypothetical protein [Candidatus Obscuribacter sp.]
MTIRSGATGSFTGVFGEPVILKAEKDPNVGGSYDTIEKQAACLATVVKDGTDRALPQFEIQQEEQNSKVMKQLLDVISKEGLDTDSAEPLMSSVNKQLFRRGVELRYDSEGREADGKILASLTLYDKAATKSDAQGLVGFQKIGSAEIAGDKH